MPSCFDALRKRCVRDDFRRRRDRVPRRGPARGGGGREPRRAFPRCYATTREQLQLLREVAQPGASAGAIIPGASMLGEARPPMMGVNVRRVELE
jgi:hypothetical protein